MIEGKITEDKIDGLSSAGLLNAADEYLQAAYLVHKGQSPDRSLLTPLYFHVCQSVELALKAYLRGSGKAEKFLRSGIGHDLVAALNAAEQEGLLSRVKIGTLERRALTTINEFYSSKDLNYPMSYYFKSYPTFEALSTLAEKLIVELDDFCVQTSTVHDGKPTAVVCSREK